MKDVFPNEFYMVVDDIVNMRIRGAAKIAQVAVKSLLTVDKYIYPRVGDVDEYLTLVKKAAKILVGTRPTAVSLPNGLRFVLNRLIQDYKNGLDDLREISGRMRKYAEEFIEISNSARRKIGEYGAGRIEDGDLILTHCNSRAALAVIITAFNQGKDIRVIVTETRPRFQGRITAETLDKIGIDVTLIVDSASRYFMNKVDKVIVGADAVAANGAVVNKIGTSLIALAAHEARAPFMVAAETFKFSPDTLFGKLVTIEERDYREVVSERWIEHRENVKIRNPAFDVTPPEYIDLIITEVGVVGPSVYPIVIKERFGIIYAELEPWEE